MVGLVVTGGVAALLGAWMVFESFRIAENSPKPDQYTVFWIGILLVNIPVWVVAMVPRLDLRWRQIAVAIAAFLAFYPKLLRTPTGPIFKDELAHYQATAQMVQGHSIFGSNDLVPIIRYFPGLHVLTGELTALSGLSVWGVALVLLAVLHVASLFGVWAIARLLWSSDVAGAGAALIYAVSPAFPYTDSFFVYESLAIPFAIWALYCVLRAAGDTEGRSRARWVALGTVCAAGCVVTHHLTTYEFAAAILVCGVAFLVCRRRRDSILIFGMLAGTLVMAIAWIEILNIPIVHYLKPYPVAAVHSIGPIFDKILGIHHSSTSTAQGSALRGAFSQSALPRYEQVAGYLAPVLAAGCFLWAGWVRRRRFGAIGWSMAVIGVAYFASLPFVLSPLGNPGAHRSWALTYVGVAVVVGCLLTGDGKWLGRFQLGFPLVLCILLMGNYAVSQNASEMFPGPYEVGFDGRTETAELVSLAKWFQANEGPGQVIAADRDVFPAFAAYADAQKPNSYLYPYWRLFYPTELDSAGKYKLAQSAHVRYMVVDLHAINYDSAVPLLFAPNEGQLTDVRSLITPKSIFALVNLDWISVVRRTPYYIVLKVDTLKANR